MKKDLDKVDSGFESAESILKKIHAHYGTTQSLMVPHEEYLKDTSENQVGHKEPGEGGKQLDPDCDKGE